MEQLKRCFKCHVEKPLSDFYAHPQMADGHLGKCKECNKRDVQENYRARRPQYKEYERKRFQKPKRKRYVAEQQRAMREREPQKYKARKMVHNAIRDGKLIRQPCERQPCDQKAQAHHENYSKPLDVTWLCFKHHREHHGQHVD